jgi:hypothetical protein
MVRPAAGVTGANDMLEVAICRFVDYSLSIRGAADWRALVARAVNRRWSSNQQSPVNNHQRFNSRRSPINDVPEIQP